MRLGESGLQMRHLVDLNMLLLLVKPVQPKTLREDIRVQ
jgi:hypothetical protein